MTDNTNEVHETIEGLEIMGDGTLVHGGKLVEGSKVLHELESDDQVSTRMITLIERFEGEYITHGATAAVTTLIAKDKSVEGIQIELDSDSLPEGERVEVLSPDEFTLMMFDSEHPLYARDGFVCHRAVISFLSEEDPNNSFEIRVENTDSFMMLFDSIGNLGDWQLSPGKLSLESSIEMANVLQNFDNVYSGVNISQMVALLESSEGTILVQVYNDRALTVTQALKADGKPEGRARKRDLDTLAVIELLHESMTNSYSCKLLANVEAAVMHRGVAEAITATIDGKKQMFTDPKVFVTRARKAITQRFDDTAGSRIDYLDSIIEAATAAREEIAESRLGLFKRGRAEDIKEAEPVAEQAKPAKAPAKKAAARNDRKSKGGSQKGSTLGDAVKAKAEKADSAKGDGKPTNH